LASIATQAGDMTASAIRSALRAAGPRAAIGRANRFDDLIRIHFDARPIDAGFEERARLVAGDGFAG